MQISYVSDNLVATLLNRVTSEMSKSPITIQSFFIFNSDFGPTEGEEEKKILFYYPESADIDTKIKNVGLCEALIKFTSTFNPDKLCEAVHTQKTKQLFLNPEDDFWIVMVLNVPYIQKCRDNQIYLEYQSEEVQDHVFQALLSASYKIFRLKKGTFSSILSKADGNVEVLKHALDQFFRVHLTMLKLNQVDLLDVFQGIKFLPLERSTFLKIQCFVNLLETTLSQIKHTVFLFNDQLAWTGLEQEDMQVFYRFLILNVIPAFQESELKGGVFSPTRCSPMGSGMHFGRFMMGPKNLNDCSAIDNVPKVYLRSGTQEFYFVAYRALSATVCLLVDSNYHLTLDFFKTLDCFLGPHLSSLASEVGEHFSKTINSSSLDIQPKYLYMYFNHMNLAQKSTVHSDMKRMVINSVTSDVIKLLADINFDLSKLCDTGEIIGKTVNDCWVIGKLSDRREFYVVLQQKNANIVDVNEEVKKLCAAYFQNIFILY